jgi:uncharacterized protein
VSASAIYVGTVRHRRFETAAREFRHPLAFLYLDLEELPRLLEGRLVRRRPGWVRVRRRDLLGDPSVPPATAVRRLVRERTGAALTGPVRVLSQPRTLGHSFNPVSFYFCLDAAAEVVEAVVAEVTNTPWGERHAYVLRRESPDGILRGSFSKALHVSPFMGMDHRYELRATEPGEALSVHIESHRSGRRAFDATLALDRRPLTRRTLARVSARWPAASLRTLALIYGHAAGLKLAGVPVHRHPRAS